MHENPFSGDDVYLYHAMRRTSSFPVLVPQSTLVNEERRKRTAERKALGMTGKQYRRYLKRQEV